MNNQVLKLAVNKSIDVMFDELKSDIQVVKVLVEEIKSNIKLDRIERMNEKKISNEMYAEILYQLRKLKGDTE